jgi:heptosyltransferase I
VPAPLRHPADRVCIVLLTGLGDVVNGLPLVNALKAHDPARHVTWVVEPMPAAVLRPHASVDDVVVYEKRRGIAGVADLRRKLAGRRFDLTINLNVYLKSAWPTLLSRAPHRMGFERGRAMDGVWLAANDHLPRRPRAHTLDMFLEFAEHLGLPVPSVDWRLEITDEERAEQEAFFAPLRDRPVVGIVPASANAKKDWFADRYARVIDALEHDFGYRTVLIGGPGGRETAMARAITEAASANPVWGLGDGIRRLVWMVDGCDLLIAPDTGPVHIARALDVPVIGLYGHTNPWRVGPYRRYQELWVDRYTDEGEAPDASRWDPKLDRMERITADDVLERVQRAAGTYLRGARSRR